MNETRRQFLKTTTLAASAVSILPRHVLGGAGHVAPSEKTTLAAIGTGGQGMQDLNNLLQFNEIQVVSVCDVNRESGGYLSWNWNMGTYTINKNSKQQKQQTLLKFCQTAFCSYVTCLHLL